MLPSNVKIIKPRAQVVIDEQPLIQYIRVAAMQGYPQGNRSKRRALSHNRNIIRVWSLATPIGLMSVCTPMRGLQVRAFESERISFE